MADFFSGFWSFFIGTISILSIIGMIVFTAKFSDKEGSGTTGHVWDEDLQELNNPLPRWWLNLFYITLAFGAIYLVLYPGLGSFDGILGWSQKKQYDEEIQAANKKFGPIFEKYLSQDLQDVVKNNDALIIGKRLFSTYCTTCHGSDARGARGFPNLADNDWLYGGTPEMIKTTILNGRQGIMPPWGTILGNDKVIKVSEYVKSLSGQDFDPALAPQGKEVFSQYCFACHGMDGKGNQALGAPNLTDDIWLHGGSRKSIQESIANGRQSMMPPHKEFLGEAKIHLLSAHVYSLSQSNN
ncbi:MAG: cytochrome-c oxidase, cbb3-type subunit III [Gammaproteobacteria bacterium]